MVPATAQPPATPSVVEHGSDFNGDGFADLAVKGGKEQLGFGGPVESMHVIYGSADGLTSDRNQFFREDQFPEPDIGEDSMEGFAQALAAGDFDGDGFSDLAIADTYEIDPNNELYQAGRVRIVYGSASGLTLAGTQTWSQGSPGIDGDPKYVERFGESLVAADFGRGPQDDLAVGVPGEWVGVPDEFGDPPSGAVNVIYGSPAGLAAAGNQLWTQDTPGIPGRAERQDEFGSALAAGHFAGRAHADLAVGVRGEDIGSGDGDQGAVHVLYGSASGLTVTGNQVWSQASAGIAGRPETYDSFGWSLAAGNFTGSRYDALAVGAAGETVGRVDEAGAVHVIYGSRRGLTARGSQIWSQRSRGVAGTPEKYDMFGGSLAAANLGRDRAGRRSADLVIGVESESIGAQDAQEAGGVVHVLYGSRSGVSARRSQAFSQDTPGLKGAGFASFGTALAAADFGRDGPADLAIGNWGAQGGGNVSGAVHVLYGFEAGVSVTGDQVWTPARLGRGTDNNEGSFGLVMTAR